MLNNQKRFVFSAAVAAVLVLLVGGANALAVNNNVWTVSKSSSNSTCQLTPTPVLTCNNITSAVGKALSGDIILVGPGTYNESVTINTDSLSIFGAQHGRDARQDRHNPNDESIVDATGTGGAGFYVDDVPFVVIDGFTIRGSTGSPYPAGVIQAGVKGGVLTGAQVLNNIIEDNGIGVVLFYTEGSVVEGNLIKNNNAEDEGYGVVDLLGVAVAINDNEFSNNQAAAVTLLLTLYDIVDNNTSNTDGSLVVLLGTLGGLIRHNRGKNFGAEGCLPVDMSSAAIADAAIDIGEATKLVEISDNDLEEGRGSISNGIAFTTIYGTTKLAQGVVIKNNTIKGFKQDGIVAESASGTGIALYSSIVGNDVRDNGRYGINIEAATTNNTNISLFENVVTGSGVLDCNDLSVASGPSGYTLGTHDTWYYDIGKSSFPVGICSQGMWH
jgi:parallel beta-helix repeat protein